MNKRKSESQWIELVKEFKSSGLKLAAWCREKQISKSSIYPYLKKYNNQVESADQEWGVVPLHKSIEKSPISLKIGAITLDIKSGFDKETLS